MDLVIQLHKKKTWNCGFQTADFPWGKNKDVAIHCDLFSDGSTTSDHLERFSAFQLADKEATLNHQGFSLTTVNRTLDIPKECRS